MRFPTTLALLTLFAAAAAKNATDLKTQALDAFYAVDDDIDKKRHVLRNEGAKKAVGYLLNQTAYLLKNKTAATEEFVAYGTTKIDDVKGPFCSVTVSRTEQVVKAGPICKTPNALSAAPAPNLQALFSGNTGRRRLTQQQCDCQFFVGGCRITTPAPAGQACKCVATGPSTCTGTVVPCVNPGQAGCLSTCTPTTTPAQNPAVTPTVVTSSPPSSPTDKSTWRQNAVWNIGSSDVPSCVEDPWRIEHADRTGLYNCYQGGGNCNGYLYSTFPACSCQYYTERWSYLSSVRGIGGGCRIKQWIGPDYIAGGYNFAGTACNCYQSGDDQCGGRQILCANPWDPTCLQTGTTAAHCAAGGGDCNGYNSDLPAYAGSPGKK